MSRMSGRLRAWIAPRWDGPEHVSRFLAKPLPPNVSWLHTLGGLLLVYLLFQTLTGILLGLYYSASPDSAYDSVRYVRDELFLGSFLHHLHRCGAGFIMVTAFLHLARSYFLAAYKSPRELLWVSGLLLGVLLTLFAFTGTLLPYDQRGYWATVVGIQIASSAPVFGDSIRALLTGGYGDIGATTISRFYVLHVCVLPLALVALAALHLGILQKTGPSGPTSGAPESLRPFYPSQAVRDLLVAAGGSLGLFLVAALVSASESGPANPASADFVPRPEWYFLSHYQILKWLPGDWQILGTFVLPNALLGILLLLPFFDRRPERSPRSRPVAMAAGAVVCMSIVGLTVQGVLTAPESEHGAATEVSQENVVERGRQLFAEKKCAQCHTIAGQGGTKGPELSRVGRRLRIDYLPEWIRNPRNFEPMTEMPSFEGTEDELKAVVEYLLTLD